MHAVTEVVGNVIFCNFGDAGSKQAVVPADTGPQRPAPALVAARDDAVGQDEPNEDTVAQLARIATGHYP